MTKILRKIKLGEVSLVPKGANQYALAPIAKNDHGEDNVNKEELEKALKEVKDYKDKLEKLQKANDEQAELLEKANKELEELNKPKEDTIKVNGEVINKADLPKTVVDALAKAEESERLAKLEKAATSILPNFEKAAAMELMGYSLTEETIAVLQAADKLFNSLTNESGQEVNKTDMLDPLQVLENKIDSIMKSDNLDKAQAFAKLASTSDGAKIIQDSYKK